MELREALPIFQKYDDQPLMPWLLQGISAGNVVLTDTDLATALWAGSTMMVFTDFRMTCTRTLTQGGILRKRSPHGSGLAGR